MTAISGVTSLVGICWRQLHVLLWVICPQLLSNEFIVIWGPDGVSIMGVYTEPTLNHHKFRFHQHK